MSFPFSFEEILDVAAYQLLKEVVDALLQLLSGVHPAVKVGWVCHFVTLNQRLRGSNGKSSTPKWKMCGPLSWCETLQISQVFHFGPPATISVPECEIILSCEKSAMGTTTSHFQC